MKQTICSVGDTIFQYLCDRNRPFGTRMRLRGNVIEVELT